MKNGDIKKLIDNGDVAVFSISPDIKTEVSKKQIDGIVSDMKKHLAKKKMVHIVVVKE